MADTAPTKGRRQKSRNVSPRIMILSANLDSLFDPPEITCAHTEPYGAILLTRFRSGEEAEQFELSAAEIDTLIATNRKRLALISRFQASRAQAWIDPEPDDEGVPF